MRHVEREIGYTIVNLEIACAYNIFVAEKRWLAVYDPIKRPVDAKAGTLHFNRADLDSVPEEEIHLHLWIRPIKSAYLSARLFFQSSICE